MDRNSLLIGYLKLGLHKLYLAYENSLVYRILHGIYLFFSRAWANSAVIRFLSKRFEEGRGIAWKAFAQLFSLPRRIGDALRIERAVRASAIAQQCYGFLCGILRLNTRMLCVTLCAFSAGCAIGRMVFGTPFSLLMLLPFAVGVIVLPFRANLTERFARSGILRFVLDTFALDFAMEAPVYSGGGMIAAVLIGLACGALGGFRLVLGAAALIGIFGVLAVIYRPFVGVVACVAAAPFVPTMVLAAMVIGTLLSLLLYSMTHREFRWRLDGIGMMICVFLLITWLSVFSSYHRINSMMVAGLTSLFVLFFFCVVNAADTRKKIGILLKLFVLSAVGVAVYGILQYLFGWGANVTNAWLDEEMFEDAALRVYSTLENPNVLGEYLLLAGFACAGLMCSVRHQWQKIVYGAMLVVLFACLILTQSRGCWLGLMVGVTVLVTISNGRLWGFLPLALAAVPFVLPESVVTRFSSIGNLEDSSSSYRVFIWLGTINMLKDFWLNGIGMGEQAYNSVYPYYSYNAIVAPHSHNLYLQMMVHSGIPALIALIAIAWLAFRYLTAAYRINGKRSQWGLLAAAVGCGIGAFLFQGIFDYVFYNYRVMMIFWAVIGMAAALYHTGKEQCR